MNSKKAVLNKFLISSVIILVTILIIAAFQSSFFKKTDKGTAKEICKSSVLMHSMGRMGSFSLDLEAKCPTQEVYIKTNDDNQRKYELAKTMYDCWDQFGEGKLELFGDEETIYCHVCHVIAFKDKDSEVEGFPDYLATKSIPGMNKISYLDFFMNYETPHSKGVVQEMDPQDTESIKEATIDTSKTYATIFAYAKGEDGMAKIKTFLSGEGQASHSFLIGVGIGAGAAILVGVGLVSNPVGWIILGVGVVVMGVAAAISYFFDDNEVEWSSFILFREYDEDALTDIGCEYIPLS